MTAKTKLNCKAIRSKLPSLMHISYLQIILRLKRNALCKDALYWETLLSLSTKDKLPSLTPVPFTFLVEGERPRGQA